jgi:predicted RND superfamily exporter protein
MAKARSLERVLRALPRHSGWLLALSLTLTVAAGFAVVDVRTGEFRIRVDASADRLLPDDAPARTFHDSVRRLFGSDEAVVVVLAAPNVFDADILRRIRELSRRLAALEEVDRVVSLTEAPIVRTIDGDIVVESMVPPVIPTSPAALAALEREALADPSFAGTLVGRDGDAAALVILLHELSDGEYLDSGLDGRILALAEASAGDAADV